MWTLISGINFRATKRRLARGIVATAVVLGTCTQVASALLPQPAAAGYGAASSAPKGAPHINQTTTATAGAMDATGAA